MLLRRFVTADTCPFFFQTSARASPGHVKSLDMVSKLAAAVPCVMMYLTPATQSPEATLPMMYMPDCLEATWALMQAPREKLSRATYNVRTRA